MTLEEKVDAWCAAARRRLHACIEARARHAAGIWSRATLNRSLGQLYRDRAAEAHETTIRG